MFQQVRMAAKVERHSSDLPFIRSIWTAVEFHAFEE
jgi:hypothetical protein